MAREIAIWLYLSFFKAVFNIFNSFPLKNKVTFMVSFTQNPKFVYEEMLRQQIDVHSVFICTKRTYPYFRRNYPDLELYRYETWNLFHILKSMYHIATSKYIMIDNYYGFLSVADFKEGVQCIQLWHAAGALKKFALEDQTINDRSYSAKERFRLVYGKFDKVVVGSNALTKVYEEAFNLNEDKVLKTGIPRTDFFFDEQEKACIINRFFKETPILQEKKVILYAPTFRDQKLNDYEVMLNLDQMKSELGNEFVVLVRFHPAVKPHYDLNEKYEGFAYDFSSHPDINELLLITDYLITDYSSIPFEFSLLERPMIFFPYDLEEYTRNRGVWKGYCEMVPGPVVFTTDKVIELIKNNDFDMEQIQTFSAEWNAFSDGNASKKFVKSVFSKNV